MSQNTQFTQTSPVIQSKFKVGDYVKKVTGEYHIFGTVRSVFVKEDGGVRLVVEHKAEGGGSFLHIYGESNLELQEQESKPWYPDDSDKWVESTIVPSFEEKTYVEILYKKEREAKQYEYSLLTVNGSSSAYDLVAYKVIPRF